MCIIVVKGAGVDLPSEERLRLCFEHNPDGAGLMFVAERSGRDRVIVRKGLMTFDAFMDALAEVPDPVNEPLVLHFRIGTHGANVPAMTHPFPVSRDYHVLTATRANADVAIAHNGILYQYSEQTDEAHSDSLVFVRDVATQVATFAGWYHSHRRVKKLAAITKGNRLAILSSDRHIETMGGFVDGKDGCFYSGDSFEPRVYSYAAQLNWKDYEDGVVDWMRPSRFAGSSVAYGGAANVLHSTVTFPRAASPYAPPTKVYVAFIPSGSYVRHNGTGSMFDADRDCYLFDRAGRVYLLDDDRNGVVALPEWSALDDEGHAIAARPSECILFHLLDEEPW